MNIDWPIALGVFLLMVSWAFVFYTDLFAAGEVAVPDALEVIADRVMENLSVRIASVPIRANISNVTLTNKVLTFTFQWPYGKNATKVFKDGVQQSCNITGDTLYWQSTLARGVNYFTMTFADQNVSQVCTGGFTVVNQTQVIPFAVEEGSGLSYARIKAMNATAYADYKAQLDLNRDFNVTITNDTGTVVSYGQPPPRQSDVFSKKILSVLEETGGNITIRFLTW